MSGENKTKARQAAEEIATSEKAEIKTAKLVKQLHDERKTYATEAEKVIQELAEVQPKLLAEHVSELVEALLGGKRFEEMAAHALARTARVASAKVSVELERLADVFENANHTVQDGIVRTFTNLCLSSVAYQERVEPTLMKALTECEPDTLLEWSRVVLPALKGEPHANTREVVELRLNRIPRRIAQQIAEDLNLKLNVRYR